MLRENQKTIIVFEDDANFRPYFTEGLHNVLKEASYFTPSWDFMWVLKHYFMWKIYCTFWICYNTEKESLQAVVH